jgi:hypothetical protein
MRLNNRSGPADINAEKTIAKSVVMISSHRPAVDETDSRCTMADSE